RGETPVFGDPFEGPLRPFYPSSPVNAGRTEEYQETAGPDRTSASIHDVYRQNLHLHRLRDRLRRPGPRAAPPGHGGLPPGPGVLPVLPPGGARDGVEAGADPPQPPRHRLDRHPDPLPGRLRRLRPTDPAPVQAAWRPAAVLQRLFRPAAG